MSVVWEERPRGFPYPNQARNPAYHTPNGSKRLHSMRGDDQQQFNVFSYVAPEDRVPTGSSAAADREGGGRSAAGDVAEFDKLYAEGGRASIAPERLLRALLLQVFYSIRSERMLMRAAQL